MKVMFRKIKKNTLLVNSSTYRKVNFYNKLCITLCLIYVDNCTKPLKLKWNQTVRKTFKKSLKIIIKLILPHK